jgi:hypothetical protein
MSNEQSKNEQGTGKNDNEQGIRNNYSLFTIPCLLVFVICYLLSACEMYGRIGGADRTVAYVPSDDLFEDTMSAMSGVWYSHNAGIGRLDGYRIGKWKDFKALVEDSGKTALFPEMSRPSETYDKTPFTDNDYFVFYDDSVYGQSDDGVGGNGGWGNFVTRYIGIVRAINVFNGDKDRGAVIIEYLKGCAPRWLDRWPESSDGRRPFFGIYYRVLDSNTVQMANAVDLAALYAGERYYTERATLEEAIAFNDVENEAEFISWGVAIPQNREQ